MRKQNLINMTLPPPVQATMENTQETISKKPSQENLSNHNNQAQPDTPISVDGKIDIEPKRAAAERSSSRYLGVRQRPSGRWVAEIKESAQKLRLWLGTFDTPQEAALAYDTAARLLRGPNAKTNFPLLLHRHHKNNNNHLLLHHLVHHAILKKKQKKKMLNNISWLKNSKNNCNIDSLTFGCGGDAFVEDTIVCPSSASDDHQYGNIGNNSNNNDDDNIFGMSSLGCSKVYSSVVVAPTFISTTASSLCQGADKDDNIN